MFVPLIKVCKVLKKVFIISEPNYKKEWVKVL